MSKIQKIYDYLKACNGFFFATCDGDKPRVRPFGFMMIFEDKLYFGMGTHKESYRTTAARGELLCRDQSVMGVKTLSLLVSATISVR